MATNYGESQLTLVKSAIRRFIFLYTRSRTRVRRNVAIVVVVEKCQCVTVDRRVSFLVELARQQKSQTL